MIFYALFPKILAFISSFEKEFNGVFVISLCGECQRKKNRVGIKYILNEIDDIGKRRN